ncbi:bifunctional glycosyltransferase family 2 protein/CDP-glycerol:glycerophosphate glycerophosphotransferase [Lentibacillus sp. L22]|uniref:bifunctional glycosyltransferase/CDP-glycerol:glycerophosphate glycerophosphotransferase n=1 Tax=Lentibacillus TaxID=175304 RepID=UPI0022B08D59|nr:bifunctional glycosyltransferase family 2 protein/CDP-glycerol:glycerophosphate glycerophosphotransferase [Lentibacillus daqui]
MGKISVITPVYNTEGYVYDCLKSLMEQTYTDLEILLINDNSNEYCTQLLEKIAKQDDRIQLFHFSERKGVGAARNFGIKKASGEFIYFLDSDDYLPEKTLEILVNHIKHHDMIRGKVKSTHFSKSMAIILDGLFNVKTYIDKRFKLIKNRSAVNFLFKRDYIIKENLHFSEDVEVYADLTFLIPALIHSELIPYIKEAVYFKRKRNDPINNPSLTQSDEHVKISSFLDVYNTLKQEYSDDELADRFLDNQLLNFYRKNVITYFKQDEHIDDFFPQLVEAVNKIDPQLISQKDFILKREIYKIKTGNVHKYKKVNTQHRLLREIREGLKTKRKFFILLYRKVFMKFSMKEKLVFFESFLGKNYSDNPKYIYEYLLNNDMGYKCVWSVREKKNIPGNPIQVKRFSLRYYYYLARAKYWVSNIRLPKSLDKREGNVYLQTWHGTPLKTLVLDQKDIFSADPKYKENFYIQSRRWDYLSSPNEYSSKIFRRAFKFDKEMLEFGYPRNDILYQKNNFKDINDLKQNLNLPLDKKVILYAPTWRDDEFFSRGNYKFTLKLELDKMQENLSDEYILLLRTHYHIANRLDVSEYEGFVYDFSLYDDIAELYLISDMLITDYSSVFFDYANLKRPILFYTYDIEKYRDQMRGFYFDMEKEVPGPLLMTTDEVVDAVQHIDDVRMKYHDTYNQFYNKFCLWDNGNASRKTVQRVFEGKSLEEIGQDS